MSLRLLSIYKVEEHDQNWRVDGGSTVAKSGLMELLKGMFGNFDQTLSLPGRAVRQGNHIYHGAGFCFA